MLRRDRQMRMQIHQLMDAFLIAFCYWLAYELRASELGVEWFKTEPSPFISFLWLYVILIPVSPLVLEAQGFYDRPLLASRRAYAWPLFKACFIITVTLVLAVYFFDLVLARSVMVMFGFIAFAVLSLKEELLRLVYRSSLARSQYERRFLLVGAESDTASVRREL